MANTNQEDDFDNGPITMNTNDDAFETEYHHAATPRPGGLCVAADTVVADPPPLQREWTFTQAAKRSAMELKRRRSPCARTQYYLLNRQVKMAFDKLQEQIEKHPNGGGSSMTQADFELLKHSLSKFRVKINVHDSLTFQEIRLLRIDVSQQEQAAELTTHNAFIDKTPGNDQVYIDAKDRYLDLKYWNDELTKEIRRIEPKMKYNNIGGGLFKCDLTKTEPPGVPSQHANITNSSAHALRNILSPQTCRRTFISLSAITDKIRTEVAMFLTDNDRVKDRAEVVKQIKEAYAAAATKKQQRQ
jgi:hypothetical protein